MSDIHTEARPHNGNSHGGQAERQREKEAYCALLRHKAKKAIASGMCWKCKGSGVLKCNRCRGTGRYRLKSGCEGGRCYACHLGVAGPCHACRGTGELQSMEAHRKPAAVIHVQGEKVGRWGSGEVSR